jgi:hypothetical protein
MDRALSMKFDPELVKAAVEIAAKYEWPVFPGDLADKLGAWSRQERPYKQEPYVALDALLAEKVTVPRLHRLGPLSYRREVLVHDLRLAWFEELPELRELGLERPIDPR